MLQTRNSKKEKRGRVEVFRRTLITSQCSPVDRAHTDTTEPTVGFEITKPRPCGQKTTE